VFVLRWKHPDVVRPFHLSGGWGYPVVPALFLLVTVFLLVNTFIAAPLLAMAGLGLIVLGLPVYAYFAPRVGPVKEMDWFARND
jgi:APA family basic amino acid/polyamine antiporter